ncbi:hypothetical protein CLV62_103226 [Dysgonomonas alginatilytica]|uniref:N-acetyltransferase domain-containing protein n=1 Tax=Dysgonomonas alginatilytica TaxID=1605892 RepID=A0A2V3PRY2_9BACT|nr:GNAT family N-acetyltransferase [Dysgonomonas alginatilytica]PXV67553.1 hypothetical protein CLV62_103226 [Dysgonomonas alginatilytica]
MDYEIKHNAGEERFEALANLQIIGVINYYKENDVLVVTHTGVESKYEGQGIAGALTKCLLTYIVKNNLKVTPLCSYTKAYIDRHPEYQNLLQEEYE